MRVSKRGRPSRPCCHHSPGWVLLSSYELTSLQPPASLPPTLHLAMLHSAATIPSTLSF